MSKVYVSVPISGNDYNDQRSHAFIASANLAQKGYEVITAFDIVPTLNMSYSEALGKRIAALLDCDIIYLCKGWEKAKDCRAELEVALVYGKSLITE